MDRTERVVLSVMAVGLASIVALVIFAIATTPPIVEQERQACANRVCPAPSRPLAIDTGKHGHPDGMFCVCAAGEPERRF